MGKSEMGSPAPAQLLDSGLSGLSLVAGYYRIAGDTAQLKHQLALSGRTARAEDIVRGANILQLKSRILRGVNARRLGAIPIRGFRPEGGWFRGPALEQSCVLVGRSGSRCQRGSPRCRASGSPFRWRFSASTTIAPRTRERPGNDRLDDAGANDETVD